MTSGRLFHVHVNPLQFPEVDEPWASVLGTPPTAESVLRFACGLTVPSDLPNLIDRYREISTESNRLNFLPVDQRLDDKLTGPLRAAKAAYMLGSSVASISLSGMVAEMLAILLWELAEVTINGRRVSPRDEQDLFGSGFERLGQERRVSILRAYGLISEQVQADFTAIRQLRRKYLHLWTQDHNQLAPDAIAAYHAAIRLAIAVIGQDVQDGRIRLTEQILRYLDRRGHLQPLPDSEHEAV